MQRAINMHNSQRSHGKVLPTDFVSDGDNAVVIGYEPSIVRIYLVDNSLDPQLALNWFETMPDNQFSGTAMVDSCIETNENGFVLDGAAAVVLDQDTDGFLWEAIGCRYDDDYRESMNPEDPVSIDGSMDFIQPVVDDSATEEEEPSDDTDIKADIEATTVLAVDNGLLSIFAANGADAASVLAEIESENDVTQTYNIYADDTGAPDLTAEKTTVDALVTGDWLVVTAEDEETTANYEITVLAS